MYEVEAKVPLSKADFQRLKREIPKIATLKKRIFSKDSYYGNLKKAFFFRIREENKKPFLHLKVKKRGEGIEMNQEIEMPLTSASKFHQFLQKLRIPLAAKKVKKGSYFKYKNMQIELTETKGLGPYLEIESIATKESEIPKAKKALIEAFKMLGFSPKDFEKRYYLEMLAEKS